MLARMAGQSEVVFYDDLERGDPLDFRRVGKLAGRDLADVLGYLSAHRGLDEGPGLGVRPAVIDGLEVTAQASPNMTVAISVGFGLAPASGTTGVVGSPPATTVDSNVRLVNKRNVTPAQAISTAPGSGIRYDLIEIGPAVTSPDTVEVDETRSVDLFDTTLKRFLPSGTPRIKMRHGEGEIFCTPGASGTSPAPTPTAGRIPIAVVRVKAGATSITQADILDVRQYLAELARGAEHSSTLRTEELTIDFPADASAARKAVINLEGVVRGIKCAFRTDAAMDFADGTLFRGSFLDPNFSDFGTFTGWTYLYVIAADDRGFRYSRAHVPGTELDVAGADWSHAGALVISKIAPSLANGSLAPSAAIKTPILIGNSTCTPGTGKAVCVGVVWWQSGTIQHGIRMVGGRARFGINDSFLPALFVGTWSIVAAGAAATTQTTTLAADFDTANNPKGPLAVDVWLNYGVSQGGTPKTCNMLMRLYQFKTGDAALGALCGVRNHVNPTDAASLHDKIELFEDVPVARVSSLRGTTTDGMKLVCDAIAGTAHTVGLRSPGGFPPVTKLAGYRWPQGAIVA